MEKITLDKKIGQIEVKEIENMQGRCRSGYMYWINGGEMEIDLCCELDLEKTSLNGAVHFKRPKQDAHVPDADSVVICYRYGSNYYSKDKLAKSFINELRENYRTELAGWKL